MSAGCFVDGQPCDFVPCLRACQRDRADALQAEVERLRRTLAEIESLRPMPIPGSTKYTGAHTILRKAREIARAALKGAPHE